MSHVIRSWVDHHCLVSFSDKYDDHNHTHRPPLHSFIYHLPRLPLLYPNFLHRPPSSHKYICTLLNFLTLYCFSHLQDYPVRPLTHTLALTHPYVRTPLNNELELLPPLQHVVGTIYPAVDAGPGFRFPISQLLNHTPPPNLVH